MIGKMKIPNHGNWVMSFLFFYGLERRLLVDKARGNKRWWLKLSGCYSTMDPLREADHFFKVTHPN